METTLIKKHLRNWWYDFRGEIIFGAVLTGLAALSFWLATYIPDEIFEIYINPTENIATATLCFFGAWILFRHAEGIKIRKVWAGILILWGCIQVTLWLARYVWGFTSIGATPEDPLYNTSITVGNTLAWLLFIYPSLVLRPGWLNWWRTLLILFPTIALCAVDYFVPADLLPLILLYPVVIFIMICSHIRKYRKWCEDNFSSMDKFDVQWIVRYLIMLAIIAISFYFICLCYIKNRMFTQQWLLLLILGYSTEQILFRKDPWAELKEEKEDEQGTKYEVDVNQMKLLEHWMETEKPYLAPDFQLTDLRQILPLNRTYLSQFINTAYGCSFYQFVNNYRIKEAKRLMSEYPQAKMVDIAKHSGFSSSSVFARTFARETGTSPKEWCLKGGCLGILLICSLCFAPAAWSTPVVRLVPIVGAEEEIPQSTLRKIVFTRDSVVLLPAAQTGEQKTLYKYDYSRIELGEGTQPSGTNEAQRADEKSRIQKYIHEGQIYIRVEDKIYDITGKTIK